MPCEGSAAAGSVSGRRWSTPPGWSRRDTHRVSESQPRHVGGADDGRAQQWNLVRQKLLLIACGSVVWAVSHLLLGLVGIGRQTPAGP